ncbi:MAG TPA: S8 family serine peptidase [Chitinophagaceae bacterium]
MQLHKKDMENEESFVSRIVVKFYDSVDISYRNENDIVEILFRQDNAGQWKDLIGLYPLIQINKLFTSVSTDGIIELVKKARALDATYNPPDLLSYYVFSFPVSIRPNELLLKLSAFREVELAYLQSAAIDPHGVGNRQRSFYFRTHLDPAPVGINAKYAWGIKGGKGSPGIRFIDIEQGWILDNNMTNAKMLPLTGINNPDFRNHGAAVLAVIMMKGARKKSMGITPGVNGYVISQWRPGGEPNDADAILAAITYLNFGDILLVETQSFYSNNNKKVWPAEVHDATFQVIRLATALGIIVIEAAGNGDPYSISGNDLDLFLSNKKRVLNPASRFFKDSGAIIVAAASMDVPHSRIRYSNYGKRINCYAWGEGVVTADNYSVSSRSAINIYPTGFTGTSSASAIIAGVAIAVQSISETRYNMRLSPLQMRHILSSDQYGTASVNGQTRDKIGVMPDLKKIIDHCLHVPTNLLPGR